jgi:hypothetical protein
MSDGSYWSQNRKQLGQDLRLSLREDGFVVVR